MKNFGKLALLGAALAVSASSAFATVITYSTTGTFSGGSGVITNGVSSSTDVFGTVSKGTTVTFTAMSSTSILSPSNVSLGSIGFTETGGGVGTGGPVSFDLNIVDTAPGSGGTNDFLGTLTGTFFISNPLGQTDGQVQFSNLNLIVGTGASAVDYSLQLGGDYLLTPSGPTSIQANAVALTPEPNSLMLLGTGLLGGAGMLMRRRRLTA